MSRLTEPGKPSVVRDKSGTASSSPATEREWALKRLEKKNKLRSDLAAYVVINVSSSAFGHSPASGTSGQAGSQGPGCAVAVGRLEPL